MQNSNQPITKLEITQDKLVDFLLHAATREDLAALAKDTKDSFEKQRAETKAEFDKFDKKFDKLTYLVIVGLIIPIVLHFVK